MVSPRCMFKLDLQKAYDTIEWQFVDQMLQALNFPDHFRKLIMLCITTPSYTLNLNGSQFGFFKGKRGLRQGDPISPLIFCICMEYLTRVMEYATGKWYFRYHPLCKSLKLTHLLFADDLLMFCKGDIKSIMLLLRALSTFSETSGLKVNASKSEVVFNGVPDEVRMDVVQIRGVIRRIEAICRNFFWSGDSEYHRVPLIAWEKVCCRKKEGGLDIKQAEVWNKATVGKLEYIKIKDVLSAGFVGGHWEFDVRGYSISSGYHWLQCPHPLVQWYNNVWASWNIPKHSLVGWMIKHQGLNTREKLFQLQISDRNSYVNCEQAVETHDHLFCSCVYGSHIIAGIENWLNRRLYGSNLNCTKLQKQVCSLALMASWYCIWQQRNECRLSLALASPRKVVMEVQSMVRARILQKVQTVLPRKDRSWLLSLGVQV
ncbi:uncharacterized protein LOC141655376 [Silene latifolia]|uniref:uncharacterized protein LOC141655376 n=1 Tax=Silene latifolia TaxID=37657 RepID=UPI003D77D373